MPTWGVYDGVWYIMLFYGRPTMEESITRQRRGVFTSSQHQHEFTKDSFVVRENQSQIRCVVGVLVDIYIYIFIDLFFIFIIYIFFYIS